MTILIVGPPPPTVPAGFTANAVSVSQINLAWSASTDPNGPGLKDYGVYRQGTGLLGYVVGTSFSDTGLASSTAYTYWVTARDVNRAESAPSATATATTSGTGGSLLHNNSFTLTGSGFGTKSRALAPLVRDTGTDAIGTVSPQWTFVSPASTNATYTAYNMLNHTVGFAPTGATIGAPHPFVGAILAGACALPYGGAPGALYEAAEIDLNFTLPTLPCVFYASGYTRDDPNWTFNGGGPPNDNNYKIFGFSRNGAGITNTAWFGAFDPSLLVDNVSVSDQMLVNDNDASIQDPDGNSHNSYWGNALSPMHAANGWKKWEIEVFITQSLGLAGGGYIKYYENGGLVVVYHGRTDAGGGAGTTRDFSYGCVYARSRNSPNNWAYLADNYWDLSGTVAIGGRCARVMVGNAATLAACTILEPCVVTAWNNTSVTATCWKGNHANGSTVYAFVITESGSVFTFGPFTMV